MRYPIPLLRTFGVSLTLTAGAFAPQAAAQELRGDIIGVVKDSGGGAIPGVRVTATRLSGAENILAEPLTSNRGETTKVLDLRLEQAIKIGDGRLTEIVDVFNVFNWDTVTNFTTISGPNWEQVLGLLPPRAVRVGADRRF
jgi:hypothetical protein